MTPARIYCRYLGCLLACCWLFCQDSRIAIMCLKKSFWLKEGVFAKLACLCLHEERRRRRRRNKPFTLTSLSRVSSFHFLLQQQRKGSWNSLKNAVWIPFLHYEVHCPVFLLWWSSSSSSSLACNQLSARNRILSPLLLKFIHFTPDNRRAAKEVKPKLTHSNVRFNGPPSSRSLTTVILMDALGFGFSLQHKRKVMHNLIEKMHSLISSSWFYQPTEHIPYNALKLLCVWI